MAKVRNVSDDRRRVGYGLPMPKSVDPDSVLQLPDDELVVRAYVCLPEIWAPADAVSQEALDNIYAHLETLEPHEDEAEAEPADDADESDEAEDADESDSEDSE